MADSAIRPQRCSGRASILTGDVVEEMRKMQACSLDAVLCDPPYDLTANKRGGSGPASVNIKSPGGRARIGTGFMGMAWDGSGVAFDPATWREVLRVLKPGAFLLAFGGTRTHHRLMCAIEDAGFEIRDCMMWLYGSGFPKSLDISKAIDKAERGVPQGTADPTSVNHGKYKGGCSTENERGQRFGAGPGQFMRETGEEETRELVPEALPWVGFGTALKPAWEPIIIAMKPCDGNFAENALRHGVTGLNIDAARIGDFQNTTPDGFDRFNAKLKETGYRPNGYQRNCSGDQGH